MLDNREVRSNGISFSWNIHFHCNYRCPYCWFHGKWADLEKFNRYPPIDQLVKSWEGIYGKYGSVHIEILGGEPFIYPHFIELAQELSRFHTLGIATNLSVDVQDLVKRIDPSRVALCSTFHPGFAELDVFIKDRLMLKAKGFGDRVAYLAYPAYLKQIDYYRRRFEAEGLYITVMTFWGEYNNISYPAGYTQEERDIIEPYLGERSGEKFQLTPKKMAKGRLCHAGHRYAVINADGNIYRCGSQLFNSDYVMGNFFGDNFQLLKGPVPCISDCCPCNEYAFLLVEDNA